MTLLLDVVGICLIAAGTWMIAPWLGLIVAGLSLLVFAFGLDRGKASVRARSDQ